MALLLRACWCGKKKKKKKGVLLACYVTWRGDRPVEGEGRRGQGMQQRSFSTQEGPSVKCVFLQFEKVESGQIGVLLSSDCLSYVTGDLGGKQGAVYDGVSSALIDTFSYLERRAEFIASLNGRIPGQTGCLHGDHREWDGMGGLCHLLTRLGAGKGYEAAGQRHDC